MVVDIVSYSRVDVGLKTTRVREVLRCSRLHNTATVASAHNIIMLTAVKYQQIVYRTCRREDLHHEHDWSSDARSVELEGWNGSIFNNTKRSNSLKLLFSEGPIKCWSLVKPKGTVLVQCLHVWVWVGLHISGSVKISRNKISRIKSSKF